MLPGKNDFVKIANALLVLQSFWNVCSVSRGVEGKGKYLSGKRYVVLDVGGERHVGNRDTIHALQMLSILGNLQKKVFF